MGWRGTPVIVNLPNVEVPVNVIRLFATTLPTKLTLFVTPMLPSVKLELVKVRFVVPVSPSGAVQGALVLRTALVKQVPNEKGKELPFVRGIETMVFVHVSKKFVTVAVAFKVMK